jgi:hypothetical protein
MYFAHFAAHIETDRQTCHTDTQNSAKHVARTLHFFSFNNCELVTACLAMFLLH